MAPAPSPSVPASLTNRKACSSPSFGETLTSSGLPGIPREVIEHKLAVNADARPVKQVLRKQSKEKLEFIVSETNKLMEAGCNSPDLEP